ncbi:MAG: hypothetical protein K2W91_10380 [Novosphingobium sp.]|nr:hypothetical protein [Novosphingobium sp.]
MRALSIFALAAVVGATGAQAQQLDRASQKLELFGDAPVGCVANAARVTSQANATFQSNGPSGGVVVFPALVDSVTATSRASSIALALPVVCNASHRVTLRSANGGLLREGANLGRNSGGFAEFQTYGVSVQWQGQTASVGGGGNSATLAQGQPAKGEMLVDIAVPQGTQPLVAGTYTDSVVVEIRPAN